MWHFLQNYVRIMNGSVAEWLKAHDSKSCGRASVSEVRILSLPPEAKEESKLSCFVSEGSTENNISSRFRREVFENDPLTSCF